MMDHKTWLWKKSSTEKTTVFDKVNIGKEEKKPLDDKASEERGLTVTNNELSVVATERNAKDEFSKQQAEVAHEAVAGWEKAKAEAKSLKQELDKAIKQKLDSEERLTSSNTSLEECMQQLHFVREEQEKRIHDAMIMTSRDYENMISVHEIRLTETSKRLGILGARNTELSKALLAKEKVINDLQENKARSDADIVSLMTKLKSTERENASLIYEIRVVEKELQIRNEERNFNRQTAEVTHKQHLESVKKIAKLESECQRLRLLAKKWLPGPAAIAKMKTEVGMLVRDPAKTRRRRSTSLTGSVDLAINVLGTLTKRASNLVEQSYPMEEENMNLKETLSEKPNDYNHLQGICASKISRLSEVDVHLKEPPEGHAAASLAAYDKSTMDEQFQASMFDMGSDGKHSRAESQSLTLTSDSGYMRNENTESPSFKRVEGSEMDLMGDFVEMEKLAIYSGDKSFSHSNLAVGAGKTICNNFEAQSAGNLATLSCHKTDCCIINKGVQSKNMIIEEIPSWMNEIVGVLLEQSHVTHRNLDEILDDIRVAMANTNHPNATECVNPKECSHPNGKCNISLNLPSKTSAKDALNRIIVDDTSLAKKSNQKLSSELNKSVRKMIELVHGISLLSPEYCTPEVLSGKDVCSFPCKISETPAGYMVRVFQWKTSDLSFVLQKFIQICNDVLNEKVDFENLTEGLTSTLEWIINHCFSLQDVSSMRDAYQKHSDWDGSRSESEIESAMINQSPEADKLKVPIVSNWKSHYNFLSSMEEPWLNAREENIRLRNNFLRTTSVKVELEGRLQSEITKTESLMTQLCDSRETIKGLQAEVENLTKSMTNVKDHLRILRMAKEDQGIQLTASKAALDGAHEKLSVLQEEVDSRNPLIEELKAKCLYLQIQLESMTKKETPKSRPEKEEKQHQDDLEITQSSQKLAECQETILNLGRQFQAMASPGDAPLFDKVICTGTDAKNALSKIKETKQRISLFDKMLAENAESEYPRSAKTKEIISASKSPTIHDSSYSNSGVICKPDSQEEHNVNGTTHQDREDVISMAIVPGKKKGIGGLFKKLLWRRKGTSKKPLCIPAA